MKYRTNIFSSCKYLYSYVMYEKKNKTSFVIFKKKMYAHNNDSYMQLIACIWLCQQFVASMCYSKAISDTSSMLYHSSAAKDT